MATILIVEDEMIIALGACLILEDQGYNVLLAPDGQAGLAQALAESPSLIVTDYMMPRMDGLTMIRELRARGVTCPIVLATSVPESNITTDPGSRYDTYLSKPYGDDGLTEIVQRLLNKG
ncbi:response regulator transcription factor [Sandarakinorhabdus sp. DWP1-3-1]|uniref:response regulator transcription factor n=1 Tax=Sandarakinorhabdus sp. DWP1-3-1 TaxID=2804627 RepID=UPI003CE8A01F